MASGVSESLNARIETGPGQIGWRSTIALRSPAAVSRGEERLNGLVDTGPSRPDRPPDRTGPQPRCTSCSRSSRLRIAIISDSFSKQSGDPIT